MNTEQLDAPIKYDIELLQLQLHRMAKEHGVEKMKEAVDALYREYSTKKSVSAPFDPPEIKPNRAARRAAQKKRSVK